MTVQNGFATHFHVSLLISMRAESLVSSQSCRNDDANAWCKRALTATKGLFKPSKSQYESEKDQTRSKRKKSQTSMKNFAFASAFAGCEWALKWNQNYSMSLFMENCLWYLLLHLLFLCVAEWTEVDLKAREQNFLDFTFVFRKRVYPHPFALRKILDLLLVEVNGLFLYLQHVKKPFQVRPQTLYETRDVWEHGGRLQMPMSSRIWSWLRWLMYRCVILPRIVNGTFTLVESEIETDKEIDKMGTIPNDIGVLVQCEHLHTFLYKPFLVSNGLFTLLGYRLGLGFLSYAKIGSRDPSLSLQCENWVYNPNPSPYLSLSPSM